MDNIQFDNTTREEALGALFGRWTPLLEVETVPLVEAAGRITAEAVRSTLTLPVVRSSRRDGIAVRSAAFANGASPTLHEGTDFQRADTGDDFDDRFDAVVQIEDVTIDAAGNAKVRDGLTVTAGLNVNPAGDNIEAGEILLEAGLPIRAQDMGAAASGGVTEVRVIRKPKVAFIPTGSELVPAGTTPKRGQNIDSNTVMARQMLIDMGAAPVMFPIVRDEQTALEACLDEALATADIVVINGGSSKGLEDYNARLLRERGEVVCHGVLAAPGRPLCLGVCGGKPVVNLPGPSIAAWFGLDWCVRAIVARALGIPMQKRPTVQARLLTDGGKDSAEGMEFLNRVSLQRAGNGYTALPILFDRIPNQRTRGFHNGQASFKGRVPKGSEVTVELLESEEFI